MDRQDFEESAFGLMTVYEDAEKLTSGFVIHCFITTAYLLAPKMGLSTAAQKCTGGAKVYQGLGGSLSL